MTWRVHWLEAQGDLTPWRDQLTADIGTDRHAVADMVETLPLDVVAQRNRRPVISQIGTNGRVHHEHLLAIRLNPDNPNFADSLADGVHPAGAAF